MQPAKGPLPWALFWLSFLVLLLTNSPKDVIALPSSSSPLVSSRLQKRNEPYWAAKCRPLLTFLLAHGESSKNLWSSLPANSTGCCEFDRSDATTTRRITCIEGVLDTIVWGPSAIQGPWGAEGFAEQGSLTSTTGSATSAFSKIDFSGNPGLVGDFPMFFGGFKSTLKHLNLSGTGLSGRMPRLDVLLPKLEVLDLSHTKLQGFANAVSSKTTDCHLGPNNELCYYPSSSWVATTPASCRDKLPPCQGTAPDNTAPVLPPPYRPHTYEKVISGTSDLKSIPEQCELLKTWLLYHDYPATALSSFTNGSSTSCCSFKNSNLWIDCQKYTSDYGGHDLEPYGITLVETEFRLVGDINLPLNTMSELKALRFAHFHSSKMTGSFPTWISAMPDMISIDLRWNGLEGPIPNLEAFEHLSTFRNTGNRFAGAVPLLVAQNFSKWSSRPNDMYACDISSDEFAHEVCWLYDPAFYDPLCITQSAKVQVCGSKVATSGLNMTIPEQPSDYVCIKSCQDLEHFVNVRTLPGLPKRLECAGPNSTACSWYLDSKCNQLAPNEPLPIPNQGVICPQQIYGWCGAASSVLIGGSSNEVVCPLKGNWTCVRSCKDKGNSVLVRQWGLESQGGSVQCLGPDSGKCSWYQGDSCKELANGEPQPHASLDMGYICTQLDFGWCKIGADAVFRGTMNRTCDGDLSGQGAGTTMTTVRPNGAKKSARHGTMAIGGISLYVFLQFFVL